MYKYTSIDGLAHSDNLKMIECWNNCIMQRKKKTEEFCDYLKKQGVKALHPDDGWVDRKENTVYFCYPDFLEEINVGDQIALGDYKEYRICQVIEIISQSRIFAGGFRYKFKEIKRGSGK